MPQHERDQTHILAQQQNSQKQAWIWMGVIVLLVALIVGGTVGYIYYTKPTPPEVAQNATEESGPPSEESPSSEEGEGESTPTPEPLKVPGVAARTAEEKPFPSEAVNKIDPFSCEGEVEIEQSSEPIYIIWERDLAEPEGEGEIDYQSAWLEAAYYDITLNGRPVGNFNYYVDGTSLNFWHDFGVLSPGNHFIRIEHYTNRKISSGLDINPADGEVDTFGPGSVGEGSCEIIIFQAAAEVSPSEEKEKATSTPEPEPTDTPTPKPPTATPKPTSSTSTTTSSAAPLGIFQSFESSSNWKRGDQPYGEFTWSSEQAHSGNYSGKLSYNFPSKSENDFVVFQQTRALAGKPNIISAWVYGDESDHFLNLWIKDVRGQVWQMSFGQIKHTGWKEMTAVIDADQPWPSGHISGSDNGSIDYPISFQALVLDDVPDTFSGRGTIYIDDLKSQVGSVSSTASSSETSDSDSSDESEKTPTRSTSSTSSSFDLEIGQHKYELWGGATSSDVCESYRNNSWNDRDPNYRGFNIELLLTNNTDIAVDDDWGGVYYITAQGKSGSMCYHGYSGSGPQPGETRSVTWFALIPRGDYVQEIRLNDVNGEELRLCLDSTGSGGPC